MLGLQSETESPKAKQSSESFLLARASDNFRKVLTAPSDNVKNSDSGNLKKKSSSQAEVGN